MWKHLIFIVVLTVAPSISDEIKSEFKKSFAKNCDNTYSLTCLKLDIVTWVEKLNEDDDYSILPGVSIIRENASSSANTADIVSNLAREFPNDPEARLDVFLMRKLTGFLNSHAIKVKPWGENDNEEVATARKKGKGGGGGGMGMLLAAGAMMKGTMMAMALAALAAIAGKALMAALASLLLSAIAALKGSGGGGGKTTYEVVAKPVYTSSHSHSTSHEDYGGGGGGHGHSGYGRSFSDQPLPLGLQPDYKPDH